MNQARLGYTPAFDGLRAVAIVLVVCYHAIPGFELGMVGVDVFFVLSGFLITSLISYQVRSGDFSRRQFYARRAIRLVPALVVTVIAFAPIGAEILSARLSWLGGIAALLYLTPFMPITIFGHTWTLAVEEWFYLLWPLILAKFFRDRLTLRQAALVMGLLAVVGEVAMIAGPGNLVVRPAALAAGAAFALWWLDGGRIRRSTLVLTGGLVCILCAAVVGPELYGPLPFWLAVVGSVGVVGAICSGADGPVRRALETAPMVAIGVVSYEWYLVHAPAIKVSDHLWGNGVNLIVVPVTLAMAFALHHVLTPIQANLRQRLEGRSSRGVTPVKTDESPAG